MVQQAMLAAVLSFIAAREEPALCQALDMLTAEAKESGESRHITIFKDQPFEPGCVIAGGPSNRGFCDAFFKEVNSEVTHQYPWLLDSCLRSRAPKVFREEKDEETGLLRRKKLIHLSATMRQGVHVDLRFEPSPTDPQHYYGRYHLTVWPEARDRSSP